MSNEDGSYWALVNAQKLSMGEAFADETDLIESSKMEHELVREMSAASGTKTAEEKAVWKNKGFFASFGLLMAEQTTQWPWYLLLSVGCVSAAGKLTMVSYSHVSLECSGYPPLDS